MSRELDEVERASIPSFSSRLQATAIDTLLAYALLPILPIFMTTGFKMYWWEHIWFWGFAFHALHVLAGQALWGRTLGKRIAGISVVSIASRARCLRIVLRETVKAMSILIVVVVVFILPIIGFATVLESGWNPRGTIFPSEFIIIFYILFFSPVLGAILLPPVVSKGRRALHDLTSGTVVLRSGEIDRYAAAKGHDTEHGVYDSAQTATLKARTGAALIDISTIATFMFVLVIVLLVASLVVPALFVNAVVRFPWLLYAAALTYGVLLHATTGATLGKHSLGLIVIGAGGHRAGWRRSLGREIVKTFPLGLFALVTTLIGFRPDIAMWLAVLTAVIWIGDAERGFHDAAAQTTVVFQRPPAVVIDSDPEDTIPAP